MLCQRLRRLKLQGKTRQKVPEIQGLKKTERTILFSLQKIKPFLKHQKNSYVRNFRPFCGPDGVKKCIFGGTGLFLAQGLAQGAVFCPSKAT